MRSSVVAFAAGSVIGMLSVSGIAQNSKDWDDVKDPKELRAIYSNKTFRGIAADGTSFVGHYRADGTGILIMGNQRIPRTWEVKGGEVCVTDAQATNCFQLRRHAKNRNEVVAQHVRDRWIAQFTIEDGIPQF